MSAATAPPLPVHIVNLTLQYLLPPTAPMPLHLLSRELLQRHHFLGISPDDPAEYFCWPTEPPSAPSIVHDLELRAGNEDLLHKPTHDVLYEHGADGSRARVRLADDLDLYVLFVWQGADEPGANGEDGWRYYDIQRITSPATTAPVPSISYADVGVRGEFADEPYTRSSSPSSDAYWDNYGASSSRNSPNQSSLALPSSGAGKPRTEEEEEAAYWASYGVVQGTADSTIPSRVPSKGRLGLGPSVRTYDPCTRVGAGADEEGGAPVHNWWDHREDNETSSYHDPEATTEEDSEGLYMSMRYNQLGLQPPLASTTAPAATHDIPLPLAARRLSPSPPLDLSAERERRKSEERDATDATALARALFPVITYQEHLESLHGSNSSGSPHADADAELVREPEVPASSSESTAAEEDSPRVTKSLPSAPPKEEENEAVSEAVRGIYKLWLAQTTPKAKDADGLASDASKAEFLALVAKAIA